MKRYEYHFEPKKGWMNDPNGLCYYKGEYHAFFQHNPFGTKWDTMYWGHAVSKDLLHWEQKDNALEPMEEYENGAGCFSGSAVEKDGRLHLFYTSVGKGNKQLQSHVYTDDGINFIKDKNNPVIKVSPFGSDDFRDPYVFKYKDSYRMVCGTEQNGVGKIVLYKSDDLENWNYCGILFESAEYGGTLECPSMFELNGKWILMFSAMRPVKFSTVFLTGSFDGREFQFEKPEYCEIGPHFYAPQVFCDNRGRTIIIGWMWNRSRDALADDYSAGAFSIPRELFLKNGVLYNYPVEEAQSLLSEKCDYAVVSGNIISVSYGFKKIFESDLTGINGLETIEKVEYLFDEKSLEIFVNDGVVSLTVYLIG